MPWLQGFTEDFPMVSGHLRYIPVIARNKKRVAQQHLKRKHKKISTAISLRHRCNVLKFERLEALARVAFQQHLDLNSSRLVPFETAKSARPPRTNRTPRPRVQLGNPQYAPQTPRSLAPASSPSMLPEEIVASPCPRPISSRLHPLLCWLDN